jgi:bifunctional non-homologous end joining protein LigD
VEPELVVEASYTEVTSEGVLRHPSYLGLREDKRPEEVTLEQPGAPEPPAGKGKGDKERPSPAPVVVSRGGSSTFAGVRVSNPDKVLYREHGITKADLAGYYEAVSGWMLPHLAERPLTIVRCPQGYHGDCFFQKHMDEVDSPAVRKVVVKEEKGARTYGAVRDLAGIITVVQLGTLELHTWNSRADRLEHPDRVTLDIDPDPTVTWADVVQAAREIRVVLEALELECYVKTTGGKGLHVVVPLVRRSGWDEVREFARAVVATVAAASPKRYTLQLSKARRKHRLLLDYYRNGRGATAVEVYSTRARTGATVSTPVSWEELEAGIDPQAFTAETVPARLAAGIDPWRSYGAVKQSITAPIRKRLGLR